MLAPHLQTTLPGTLHFGPFRLPVFALFATAGLVAALVASQKTAAAARVDRNKLWDAGIFAIAAAFFISRILLVVEHFSVFRAVPLLVLQLPSITYSGLLLTALATWLWLRLQRIPVLQALDAAAPCVALAMIFVNLGHFVEGTEAGMPTRLPWGVHTPGDTMLGLTHPVQLYAALASLLLALLLSRQLNRSPYRAGSVTSLVCLLGGCGSFLLTFLRQPSSEESPFPLDSGQIFALLVAFAGVALWYITRPGALARISPSPQPASQEFDHA